jgi:hypothetical protein
MTTYKTACYCGLGPGTTSDNISLIQKSGLTTVIEFALHIGRKGNGVQEWGDFVFNDGYPQESYPFIRNGNFNPYHDPAIAAWPNDLSKLKQSGSGVKEIFFSIGGWGGGPDYIVKDFLTIQYMLDNGMKQVLVDNFTKLKSKFPNVDGFDLDCEEFGNSPSQFPDIYPKNDTNTVGQDTIVQFSKILFDLGFKVTFCPFDSSDIWQGSMQQLCTDSKAVVSWWNLQCYAGGFSNRNALATWLNTLGAVKLPDGTKNGTPIGKNAGAFLVPGLSVQNQDPQWPQPQCPTGNGGMCLTFADMNKQGHTLKYSDLAGGFLWDFDGIGSNTTPCGAKVPALSDYVNAVNSGLSNKCS